MAPAQMVDKLRATPNFFHDAKRAHLAYEQQMQEAAAAVRRLLLETEAVPGVQLQWMRRPDPVKVNTPGTGPQAPAGKLEQFAIGLRLLLFSSGILHPSHSLWPLPCL